MFIKSSIHTETDNLAHNLGICTRYSITYFLIKSLLCTRKFAAYDVLEMDKPW